MTKEHILEEIRRTAKANGGLPLGQRTFRTETSIKPYDWEKYWVRWGDAVREAGFTPNPKNEAYSDTLLIETFIALTRELRRLPGDRDLRMKKARSAEQLPGVDAYRRLGSRRDLVSKVVEYCQKHEGLDDVILLCREIAQPDAILIGNDHAASERIGYVYLLKHGSRRDYKIGKTFNPLRREGEIALQLPEKLEPIHYIKTDDPSGIENYWQTRFANKRKEGEWFALTPIDIQAFKRWKRIC